MTKTPLAHNDHPLRHWDRTCLACHLELSDGLLARAEKAEQERDRLAAAVRDVACSPWHHRREFDFWCEQHSIAIALAQHAAATKEGKP